MRYAPLPNPLPFPFPIRRSRGGKCTARIDAIWKAAIRYAQLRVPGSALGSFPYKIRIQTILLITIKFSFDVEWCLEVDG